MDEANLVLSGLAQTDLNAWEKVADQYMWGKYSVQNQRVLEVTLNVWDGKSDPRVVTLSITNAASAEGAARDLAAMTAPLLSRTTANALGDGLRRKISDSLVSHAVALARAAPSAWFNSGVGLREWLAVVRVLETACFFDPGNRTARELWARVRWGRPGATASANEFFFVRRRSEAWRKHVEQFGFEYLCPDPPRGWWETNSVAAEFVMSAWRPFEIFKFSQDNQGSWGVPRDAGGKEIVGWKRRFGEEFLARLVNAPYDPQIAGRSLTFFDEALAMAREEFVLRDAQKRQRVLERLWPYFLELQHARLGQFDQTYLPALKRHFEQIGQPGGDQALLEQFNEIARLQIQKERAKPVRLPRASELDANPRPPKIRP